MTIATSLYRLLQTLARIARQRRELAALSDRQLHDAGIDLACAGRGRSAVAMQVVLANLYGLR